MLGQHCSGGYLLDVSCIVEDFRCVVWLAAHIINEVTHELLIYNIFIVGHDLLLWLSTK